MGDVLQLKARTSPAPIPPLKGRGVQTCGTSGPNSGSNEIRLWMSGEWTPRDRQIDQLLAILADPAKRPIYVHCMKGMDRTGIIVALHRVYNEGWTPQAAERERDQHGFNRWLVMLDRYYDRKARSYRRHERG